MSLIIEKLDGTRYRLKEMDIRVADFTVESPEVVNTTEELDGGRFVVVDSKYGLRQLNARLRFIGRDLDDYFLLMREVFQLFNGLDEFFIINEAEGGKRWRVRTDGKFTPNRSLYYGNFDITFICTPGYAESIGTSIDLQNKKEWDADLWAWGMGLEWDKEYRYEVENTEFIIKNIGNVTIDPREHELEIIVKGDFPEGVTITNSTTGDIYKYNGPLTTNDTLKLSGIRTFRNGISAFGNTNRKLLTLAPGENNIAVTGGTPTSIAFNFRFLYK